MRRPCHCGARRRRSSGRARRAASARSLAHDAARPVRPRRLQLVGHSSPMRASASRWTRSSRRARIGQPAGEHRLVQPVDGVVHRRTAVERRQHLDRPPVRRSGGRRGGTGRSRRAGSAATARSGGRHRPGHRGIVRAERSPSYSVKHVAGAGVAQAQRSARGPHPWRPRSCDVAVRHVREPRARAAGARLRHGEHRRGQRVGVRVDRRLARRPRRRAAARASGSGWLTAVARRSPRGTVTRPRASCRRRPGTGGARAATRSVGRRRAGRGALASPSNGSTCGGGGSRPSAAPMTTTRSTSSPHGSGERADVHAVADLSVAGRRHLQLGHERGAELGAGDGRTDASRGGARRSRTRCVRSHASRSTPSSRSSRPRPNHRSSRSWRPRHPWAHGRSSDGSPRADRSSSTNVCSDSAAAHLGGPRSTASAIGLGKAGLPVGVAHDAGTASDALPANARQRSAAGVSSGDVAEERHQRRCGEGPDDRARADPPAAAAPSARPCQCQGGRSTGCRLRQLVLDHAGVWPARRPEHSHAVETGATAGAVDDGADGESHLVVGIRRRDRRRPARDRSGPARLPGGAAGQVGGERVDGGVGVGVGGDPDDEFDVGRRSARARRNCCSSGRSRSREVDHDAGQPIRKVTTARPRRRPPAGHPRRTRRCQQAGDLRGDACRLVAACRASQRRQRRGPATRSSR